MSPSVGDEVGHLAPLAPQTPAPLRRRSETMNVAVSPRVFPAGTGETALRRLRGAGQDDEPLGQLPGAPTWLDPLVRGPADLSRDAHRGYAVDQADGHRLDDGARGAGRTGARHLGDHVAPRE